ncbi:permease [Pelotomaculum isophthalicicum JI]|uniref:Permease n=1 Tax=Pelotomaculum isophthalicicum JI TaxID=947010 RepID=A0A9X4JWQ1_9FIRM|nr:permease [Pelotomaculum isophthalicicum]MDF9409643.1 permease [Pelotomaculum isophthalicicum JI]
MFQLNNLITAGKYFLVISGELLALFIGISFLIALLQEFITEETIQKYLSKPQKWLGNILGATLGAVTPFCSCSTIPILVGLLNGGAPFGAAMSFLISSPLLNPVILTLFLTMMGWKFTILYGIMIFIASVFIGALWERMGLASTYKNVRIQFGCCEGTEKTEGPLNNKEKVRRAGMQTWGLFIQVLPYLIIGAGIGSFIYGFVPEEFIIKVAGPGNLFAIPVAAAIGVPMYIRVETMIPIGTVLLSKGMSLGAIMALIIGGAGASIPELTLLASIFKPKLVATFTVTILAVAILSGFIFQILQPTL